MAIPTRFQPRPDRRPPARRRGARAESARGGRPQSRGGHRDRRRRRKEGIHRGRAHVVHSGLEPNDESHARRSARRTAAALRHSHPARLGRSVALRLRRRPPDHPKGRRGRPRDPPAPPGARGLVERALRRRAGAPRGGPRAFGDGLGRGSRDRRVIGRAAERGRAGVPDRPARWRGAGRTGRGRDRQDPRERSFRGGELEVRRDRKGHPRRASCSRPSGGERKRARGRAPVRHAPRRVRAFRHDFQKRAVRRRDACLRRRAPRRVRRRGAVSRPPRPHPLLRVQGKSERREGVSQSVRRGRARRGVRGLLLFWRGRVRDAFLDAGRRERGSAGRVRRPAARGRAGDVLDTQGHAFPVIRRSSRSTRSTGRSTRAGGFSSRRPPKRRTRAWEAT